MGRLSLVVFDLRTGLWVSLGRLREHLGVAGVVRLAWGLVRRVGRDPLRGQAVPDWARDRERLVRHQLRPALQLDEVLEEDLELSLEERVPILRDVIASAGAAFVATHARGVDLAAWNASEPEHRLAWARSLVARFFNARVEDLTTSEGGLAFCVTACRFATLVRAVGRPHLAPLFCDADRVYFERAETPVDLVRSGTIGGEAETCDFALRLKQP